jgi:hypothetical protein
LGHQLTYKFPQAIQVAAINLISVFDPALGSELYILVVHEKTIELVVRNRLPKWKLRLAVFIKVLPTWFWIIAICSISSALFVLYKTTIPIDIGGVIISVIAFYFGIKKNPEAQLLQYIEKTIVTDNSISECHEVIQYNDISSVLKAWPESGKSFRNIVYVINWLELMIGFIITGVGIWLEVHPFKS